MPRPSRPWYRASRRRWFVSMNGKQVPLPVTDPGAYESAFAEWQALRAKAAENQPPARPTVRDRMPAYLDRQARRVKPHTLTVNRWYLKQFVDSFGGRAVEELEAEMLEDDARRSGWSSSTRNTYLGTVLGFLAWCGIKIRVRKPPKTSAGAKSVITEETYRIALTHCRGDWRGVVEILWLTGARPSEVARLSVENVDWGQRVARLDEHKTDDSGDARLLYFNAEAMRVLEGQRAKYGAGLLFRSKVGGLLKRQAFTRKFCRLSKRIGRRVTSYCFRHSWACRALASGESDVIVAALMGHKSTQMIWRHYAHVNSMGRQLSDAAKRISGSA
jgi:integrase